MPDEVTKEEKPKPTKSTSTQFTITAAGIAAILVAAPGFLALFKGEPVAEQVHRQTDVIVQKITSQQQKAYLALVERIIKLEAMEQAKGSGSDSELLKAIASLPSRMMEALSKKKRRGGSGVISGKGVGGMKPRMAPKRSRSSEDAPKQLRLPRLAK